MTQERICGLLVIIIGFFSVICSVGNFNWYFNNRKAQGMVRLFGRNGARVFYSIVGVIIIFLGGAVMLGM